jgi:hypothetical protein
MRRTSKVRRMFRLIFSADLPYNVSKLEFADHEHRNANVRILDAWPHLTGGP